MNIQLNALQSTEGNRIMQQKNLCIIKNKIVCNLKTRKYYAQGYITSTNIFLIIKNLLQFITIFINHKIVFFF